MIQDEQRSSPITNRPAHLIRVGAAFIVAVITSPCCIPLIVPVILALLAGTPLALWMTQHLGWVYGGLVLVSVSSLTFGWHWLRQRMTTNI